MKEVAFLGLGVMGFPMAGHLAKRGFHVRVYNRSLQKAEAWLEQYEGQLAASPAEAADGTELIALCLGNDQSVEDALMSEQGVLSCAKPGTIILDHTTTSSLLAQKMSEACKAKSVHFLDAPVSGGEAGAINGILTAMVGGHQAAYQKAELVLSGYTQMHRYFGESGKGQEAKMVNQTLIAGVLQGLSEGLLLAEKCGIDIKTLTETLSKGAAQSWQLENRAMTMSNNEFNFGFAIDHMIKDLGIVQEHASRQGLDLPLVSDVLERYKALSDDGEGRSDTSVLIKSLR